MDPIYTILLSFSQILHNFEINVKSLINYNDNKKSNQLLKLLSNYQYDLPTDELINIAILIGKQVYNLLDVSLENLDELATSSNIDTNYLDRLQLISNIVFDIRKHWRLAEISFLFQSPLLGIEFIKWLQVNIIDLTSIKVSELLSNPSNENTYLINTSNIIYSQAMKGYLNDVWDIILLDNNIIEIFNNSSNIYYNNLLDIKDILQSHPYIHFIQQIDNFLDSESEIYIINLSILLTNWKNKIFQLIRSKNEFLGRFPILSKLLLLLSGDLSILIELSDDWLILSLSKLLYIYSPPLGRSDISNIIQSSYNEIIQDNSLNQESFKIRVIESLNGNVAYIIRYIYEMSYTYINDIHLRNLILASASHLSYILFTIGVSIPSNRLISIDQIIPKKEYRNESSFVEELLLEYIECLHSSHYPIDVIIRYLSLCPEKGLEYSRTILERHHMISDEETKELSKVLRNYQLDDIAKTIEIIRGTFWLRKCSTIRRVYCTTWTNDFISGIVSLSKPILFYQLANDYNRINLLLEILLIRLCNAVRTCNELFSNLIVNPMKPSPPMIPGSSWYKENGINYDITMINNNGLNSSIDQYNELLCSIEDAKDTLQILRDHEETNKNKELLDKYVQAIEYRINMQSMEDLSKASKLIVSIISNKLSPLRHWLHFIELICWFDRVKQSDESMKLYSLINKDEAYILLNSYITLTTHFYNKRYLNNIQEDDLNNIRVTLLDILSISIVQENEEIGRINQEKQEIIDKKYRDNHKHIDSSITYLSYYAEDDNDTFVISELLSGGALF